MIQYLKESKRVRSFIHLCLALLVSISAITTAKAEKRQPFTVIVDAPFIDIRTGAGKAYPVFYIAQRGEALSIHKSKTSWYQVELAPNSHRTVLGWVHRNDLKQTLVFGSNEPASDHRYLKRDFNPAWNSSFSLGRLKGADHMSLSIAYQQLKALTYELRGGVFNGVQEEGWLVNGQLIYSPYYRWRVAPYITGGYGYIKRETSGTAVNQSDISDQFLLAGAGFNIRITPQYHLRLEYQQLNTLTETDDNKELDSWLVGLSAQF